MYNAVVVNNDDMHIERSSKDHNGANHGIDMFCLVLTSAIEEEHFVGLKWRHDMISMARPSLMHLRCRRGRKTYDPGFRQRWRTLLYPGF